MDRWVSKDPAARPDVAFITISYTIPSVTTNEVTPSLYFDFCSFSSRSYYDSSTTCQSEISRDIKAHFSFIEDAMFPATYIDCANSAVSNIAGFSELMFGKHTKLTSSSFLRA